MKSVWVLDEGSKAKMAMFCRWWQNYVSPDKECGTSLIFDSVDSQNLNKQVNHVIQF